MPYDPPQFGDIIHGDRTYVYPDIGLDFTAEHPWIVPLSVTRRFADPVAAYWRLMPITVPLANACPAFIGPMPDLHGVLVVFYATPHYYPVYARLPNGEVLHGSRLDFDNPLLLPYSHDPRRIRHTAVVLLLDAKYSPHFDVPSAPAWVWGQLAGDATLKAVTVARHENERVGIPEPRATRQASHLRRLPPDRTISWPLRYQSFVSIDDVPTEWAEHAHFRWPYACSAIIDGVLCLYPLVGLNVYVYLWILNWLPSVAIWPEQRKVALIDGVLARLKRVHSVSRARTS